VTAAVEFDNVSKFYGEVLGVNRIHLAIPPGITSLVGPNGSGKTTLMNLMTGLIQPTRGRISVLGIAANDPERLFRKVGYCTQFDSYPSGATGREFLENYLSLFGDARAARRQRVGRVLERVGLEAAADRKIAAYSKGMRQRIRLAQALAHDPQVLVLDEPLNGLDPLVRADTIALFRGLGAEGRAVILSSHVLHEVDAISDQVIMLSHGYVVAEGQIHGVRSELRDHPIQIRLQGARPREMAARLLQPEPGQELLEVLEVVVGERELLVKVRDAPAFYLALNRLAAAGAIALEGVASADDDAGSVYAYLVGAAGSGGGGQ